MSTLARNQLTVRRAWSVSRYDDFGVTPNALSFEQRQAHVDLLIDRYFVRAGDEDAYDHEAVMRNVNPGPDFTISLRAHLADAEGGFGPSLQAPSCQVIEAFQAYGRTDLGAVAIARLLRWDEQFIQLGWRTKNGTLTPAGVSAYGQGQWRPFRVACHTEGDDAVTQSGALLLPDVMQQDHYSTGDISDPFALIHHELKAHVLPLKEATGLAHGIQMGLICMRLETEMLQELGLPSRRLNWGGDEGMLDLTLHEPSEQFFHGLVCQDAKGQLTQVDPTTHEEIGPAAHYRELN